MNSVSFVYSLYNAYNSSVCIFHSTCISNDQWDLIQNFKKKNLTFLFNFCKRHVTSNLSATRTEGKRLRDLCSQQVLFISGRLTTCIT